MVDAVTRLKIMGRPIGKPKQPERPRFLTSDRRSAAEAEDEFLPDGYVQPTASFDIGPAARSADDKQEQQVAREHLSPVTNDVTRMNAFQNVRSDEPRQERNQSAKENKSW